MQFRYVVTPFLFIHVVALTLKAQGSGEEIFRTTCAACHTIQKGRLVGPDLSGVYRRMADDWLIRFIRSSQQMIREGDTAALAIYHEFNQIPMPDNRLTDEQILSIIDYIRKVDGVTAAGSAPAPVHPDSAGLIYTSETIPLGRALFNGYTRFANGASPCNACHYINDQSMIGGGKLALELTGAYTKLGPEGIKAIVSNPPFPAMQIALKGHPLNEQEVHALISLFKSVAEKPAEQQSRKTGGLIFLIISSVCTLFLLVHLYILYDNRKIP